MSPEFATSSIVTPEVLGEKKAEELIAYLLGDIPGNNEDAQGVHLLKTFQVNYPAQPDDSICHKVFCDTLGFSDISVNGEETFEILESSKTGTVVRQAIPVPDLQGAVYVTYMAVRSAEPKF